MDAVHEEGAENPAPVLHDKAKHRSDFADLPARLTKAQRVARAALVTATVVLAVLLIGLVIRTYWTRSEQAAKGQADARMQAERAAHSLNDTFARSMAMGERIAHDLSVGALLNVEVEARLRREMLADPTIDGITVAFAPGAYSPAYHLYTVYLDRTKSGDIMIQTGESRYDYTLPPRNQPDAPETGWYHNPIAQGPVWSEPFLATGEGKVLVEFGVPFYRGGAAGDEEQVAGVVAVDYSLEGMGKLIAALDLGATGYGAVYNEAGTFLAHPDPDLVAQANILDQVRGTNDPDLLLAVERALDGETSILSRIHPQTGREVWDVAAPIPATGWALIVEMAASEYLPTRSAVLREQVWILLAASGLLFSMTILALRVYQPTAARLWTGANLFALLVLVVMIVTIALARRAPENYGVAIADKTALYRYLETLAQEYQERDYAPAVQVPTGLVIQAIRFPDTTSVTVNGYLWQKVPHGADIRAGILLPQRIDEPFVMDEITRVAQGDTTLVGWSFTAVLRQVFDPVQFPLDRYTINIRLLSEDSTRNVLLVPDLDAYPRTDPLALPGLDSEVRINNWHLMAGGFVFDRTQANANLGIPERPVSDVAELRYLIRVERLFIGPFVAYVLPALVAAVMIFGYLLNGNKPDEPEEIVTALSYTAALFFVIAVMHASLRESAAAVGLTYLEYLYLLLYGAILLVAVNTFLFVRYPGLWLIRFGNNLITKMLYWPFLIGSMLIVTLRIFVFGTL